MDDTELREVAQRTSGFDWIGVWVAHFQTNMCGGLSHVVGVLYACCLQSVHKRCIEPDYRGGKDVWEVVERWKLGVMVTLVCSFWNPERSCYTS